MNIDLGSFAFGSSLQVGGGTPSWGTAFGQSSPEYKITRDGSDRILMGMCYCAIPKKFVKMPIGKGGHIYSGDESDEIQLAALFSKVYVNDNKIEYPFILILQKEESDSHPGRRSLKYSDKISYQNGSESYSNAIFIKKVREKLNLADEACWFAYNIDVDNQDTLHISIAIADKTGSVEYRNSEDRKYKWNQLIAKEERGGKGRGFTPEDAPKNKQTIYFGTPGSGKSFKVKGIVSENSDYSFRTTFHPDSDYSTFVGSYKPIKDEEKDELTYEFVPQAFTDAYIKAWQNPDHIVYLIIEEINRGNCAQIFGDLFQLLDRNENGESEYPIKADKDLYKYLCSDKGLGVDNEGIVNGELILPENLYILATMNTSDQSLFPMDSAFKRRWAWEYVPIDANNPDSQYIITIGDKKYLWSSFLRKVNDRIHKLSDSEDKQIGNFFIKGDIEVEEFKSKVMFYLWSEVCKEYEKSGSFFKDKNDNDAEFTFNSLFPTNKETNKRLQGFMDYLEVQEMPSEPDWKEFDDDTNADSGYATLLNKVKDSLPNTIKQRSHITSGNKYLTIPSNRAGYNYCATYSTRSNMLEVRYELPRTATPQKVTEINDFLTSRSIIISGLKDAPGKTTDTWHRWWIETPISDEDSNVKWIKENLEMFVSKFEI